ncbi:MAG: hypothetical protein IV090_19865 [Candidatus Sericytochromatia bacterium]|nr:hypothetical protein [Candidatus Sericytochromatia bacterium]
MPKANHPQIGEWFEVSHYLKRVTEGRKKIWRPFPNHPIEYYSKPFKGLFIGYRYLQDGTREWEDLGEGGIYIFTPTNHFLVYQFVYANNRKPVYALPIHCKKVGAQS